MVSVVIKENVPSFSPETSTKIRALTEFVRHTFSQLPKEDNNNSYLAKKGGDDSRKLMSAAWAVMNLRDSYNFWKSISRFIASVRTSSDLHAKLKAYFDNEKSLLYKEQVEEKERKKLKKRRTIEIDSHEKNDTLIEEDDTTGTETDREDLDFKVYCSNYSQLGSCCL